MCIVVTTASERLGAVGQGNNQINIIHTQSDYHPSFSRGTEDAQRNVGACEKEGWWAVDPNLKEPRGGLPQAKEKRVG